MKIDPSYTNLRRMFASQATYYVPKYQRAYAWENESIQDFLNDLKRSYTERLASRDSSHFFGGILSIKHTVVGAVDEHKYEIIDGQQRITTFTLTIRCLINMYNDLLTYPNIDATKVSMINNRIDNLQKRFIAFRQEINLEEQVVNVFTVSKRDKEFYAELMKGNIINENPEKYSHKNLLNSYKKINKFFKDTVLIDDDLTEILKRLQTFEFVIDTDFTLLHMVADNEKSAYRLFQVINDRGMSLTEGDLLRAKTLEVLEDFPSIQNSVELIWDKLLSNAPNITSQYLTWIYTSYTGKDLKKSEIFDKFLDQFFPEHKEELDQLKADNILTTMKYLEKDFENCQRLSDGEWIYTVKQPITARDRNRFEVLMNTLDHPLSMPLFIAASKLDDKQFSAIVKIVEKVFFRYILICKQHLGSLKSIYFRQIKEIRTNAATYTLTDFKTKVNQLLASKANDALFTANLKELEYDSDQSNKYLKFFLMTLEYHFPYYLQDPSRSTTKCLNNTNPYDFAGTSIEHIYPKNALTTDIDADIEPIKNTIGNLALMDPQHNSEQRNNKFLDKKSEYVSSSIEVLKYVSTHANWTKAEVEDLEEKYIDLALKHFRA
ncbi:DUF262 domain-containing HNH endonuclease family protein [Sulfurimonas sp. C5]|uniref:DUF262 domain-containing protein n=1 Tax=Sulfurimonas sp. C5 TaxID=3036947 RepID=UPI0024544FFC|nr:DUF262 domain-containing HNH endonuclease family protein [Sulfurimonas sp. C5]MDH4943958.1 DUF262 domain-containing HNH endonuclease family protein [Sulfurimonas sp. C5]